ncbi:caspase domain-containing protein [Fimicolochytrium jonesii]|uniref:caspase domain-containing protein n=1 Tax=Fimicolochytrium jonesii TaxID=1396493 RepID=UPI0022FDC44B|nr:caspase domain-containing protein [Fimicolochytrium jonesii]KAI8825273.1 caspase domain-containing protein [Fimicolochytrium jonesii]
MYPGQYGTNGQQPRPSPYGPPQNPPYPPPQQQQQAGFPTPYPPQHQQQSYPPPGPPPPYQQQQQQGFPPTQQQQYQPYQPPQNQYGAPAGPPPQTLVNAAPPPNYPPPHQPPPHQPANYQSVPTHPPPNPPAGWPQQQPHWQGPPQQYMQQTAPYLSNCSGNKKALLVGVNYFNTRSELKGCINDVRNMKNFLCTQFGFRDDPQHMLCLTDDNTNWHLQPARQNILQAMQWLVSGAKAGDSLFFHFSGHGSQQADKDGDESDGTDETICPVDYDKAGMITDDTMNQILVRPLPPGVRLTCLFDCCHSGSSLDLPFTYLPDGRLKTKTAATRLGGAAMSVGKGFLKGGVLGAGMSLFAAGKTLTSSGASHEQLVQQKGNMFADVVMLSGCKDKQTSADARIEGQDTGAMTYGFVKALSMYHAPSYGQLLGEIRNLLAGKYTQRPQLSSGRAMDMNQIFIM